jgi:hypothetical protein
MSNIPPEGYELVAWFGRESRGRTTKGERATQDDVRRYAEKHPDWYLTEEDDGWSFYAPPENRVCRDELPATIQEWLNTPVAVHVARWEREMASGIRDHMGRRIGDRRRTRTSDSGQTE